MEVVIFIIYYIVLLSLEGFAASSNCFQDRCQVPSYVRPVNESKSFFNPWRSFFRHKEVASEDPPGIPRRHFLVGNQYRPQFASRVTIPEMPKEKVKGVEKKVGSAAGSSGASSETDVFSRFNYPGGATPAPVNNVFEEEEHFGFEEPPEKTKRWDSRKNTKEARGEFEKEKGERNAVKLQEEHSTETQEKWPYAPSEKSLQILVLDDTNIDSFLTTSWNQIGIIRGIFVNSSFSHLTTKKWRMFRDKFSALDLSEVREVILKKQPAEARFVGLLKQRVRDFAQLEHLAFSGLVFDKKNMRRLQGILKELSSLSRLSFGQVELSKEALMSFNRLISSRYQGLSGSELHYTADELECGRFTYLGSLLKQSCAVKPTAEFMEWD